MRQLQAGVQKASVGVSVSQDPNTITFGVGLGRTSSMRMSDGVRRRGTVNLKGSRKAEAKRSSASYGKSFAALASPTTSPSTGEHDQVSLGSSADDDLDEDLLAGLDATIFGKDAEVDILDEEGGTSDMGPEDELDLANFGFDAGDDDEFGFGEGFD